MRWCEGEQFRHTEAGRVVVGPDPTGYPLPEFVRRLLKEPPPMRKQARFVLFPVALVASLVALSGDRRAQAAVDPKTDKNCDLASLDVFRKTIVQIKDNYVDPSRINPKEMFTASLEAVERQVAEVMVEVGGPPCDDKPVSKEPGTAAPVGPSNAAPILENERALAAGCGHANSSIPEGHVRV